MKRRDLLRHLAQHGCSLLREGVETPGGTTQASIVEALSRVTPKSMIIWRAKSAKTLGFHCPSTWGSSEEYTAEVRPKA
jgi:hypothetical protein